MTMSSKILEMAARSPRSNISNDSGCIKVLTITDSGTAESVAQIGCACVADRRSTGPFLVAFHHGSAFGGPRLSHGTLVCSSPAFIASRVVNRPLVSSTVECYCLVTDVQHEFVMCAPRSHGQLSCQAGALGHGMGDEALAETQHV